MSTPNTDREQCSLCGKWLSLNQVEEWTMEGNKPIDLRTSSRVSVCVRTTLGELDICEECYIKRNQFQLFSQLDMREIHDQFGLEYQQRRDWVSSIKAFQRAVDIAPDAKILLSIGGSYEGLGDLVEAQRCYSLALTLDPENSFARDNLIRVAGVDRPAKQH